MGLDDCLLPHGVRTAARNILKQQVQSYKHASVHEMAKNVPYQMSDEGSGAAEVNRLVQLRSERCTTVRWWTGLNSEMYVTRHVLGRRSRPFLGSTAVSCTAINQIALMVMLGTKGSVSNLIQCSHSLGHCGFFRLNCTTWQQIVADSRLPLGDFDRVFPHNPRYDADGQREESRGLLWAECFIALGTAFPLFPTPEGLSPLAFFVHAIASTFAFE